MTVKSLIVLNMARISRLQQSYLVLWCRHEGLYVRGEGDN